MSDNEQPGGFYVEQEATAAVYQALGHLIPNGYDHIVCTAALLDSPPLTSIAGGAFSAELVDARGNRTFPSCPNDVLEALTALRRVMYKPGIGTWWSVRVTVWANRRAKTDFNYTDAPTIGIYRGGISYLSDQQVFPIDEDKQPQWLKHRLADGIADLHKYGSKSYPPWLKRLIEAGQKPDWL